LIVTPFFFQLHLISLDSIYLITSKFYCIINCYKPEYFTGQEQPLLIEDLLEQEKLEQLKQQKAAAAAAAGGGEAGGDDMSAESPVTPSPAMQLTPPGQRLNFTIFHLNNNDHVE
jgi:hypothetical protein